MKRMTLWAVVALLVTSTSIRAEESELNLDFLKGKYEEAKATIDSKYDEQEAEALAAYGDTLDGYKNYLKKQGKLDAYLELDKEKNRFDAEKTVPGKDARSNPYVARMAKAYDEAMNTAKSEQMKQMAYLIQQYQVRLQGLIKKLMLVDNIEEAKLVKLEIERVQPSSQDAVANDIQKEANQVVTAANHSKPADRDPQGRAPHGTYTAPRRSASNMQARRLGEIVLTGSQEEMERRIENQKEPIVIRGAYRVPEGKKLVIGEGVTFEAEKGSFIEVAGILVVEGTAKAPVVFKGTDKQPRHWKGITCSSKQMSVSGMLIRDADVAIQAKGGTVENSVFVGNNVGMMVAHVSIKNCIFKDNDKHAIHTDFGRSTIEDCTIADNGANAKGNTAWRGVVFGSANGSFVMRNCIVSDNDEIGVGDFRHGSLVENCIVENNRPYDFAVAESNLKVKGCWMGDNIQKKFEREGYGINLPNVLDKHDGTKGNVIFTDAPHSRNKGCGADLVLGVRY